MLPLTPDELKRWRAEIDLGVEFRDKEFGTYRKQKPGSQPQTTGAGRNLDYFEQGARDEGDYVSGPPLNIIFPIIKNIVPTLLFQNPRANALPVRRDDQAGEDAFYVSQSINQDLKDSDFGFKKTGQDTVFDSYALGYGVVKIGYSTKFGQDVTPTDKDVKQKEKEKAKKLTDKLLEVVGLKQSKPEELEPEQVTADTTIKSERAYVQWISPWDFVVDPRARDLPDARWVAQRGRRTIADIKRDKRFGSAKYDIQPEGINDDRIPETFIEEFESADEWEVHYKDEDSPTGINVLIFAATQGQTEKLMHEHNVYDLGGWQYEWLALNKHGHRLYPVSTISILRPLVDRLNSSLDAILEQIDRFQAKIAHNDRVNGDGLLALQDDRLGATVKVDGQEDVRSAISVISMQQVAGDMVNFLEKIVDFIILITGLTRAQLTGLTTAQTATEAQIGQSGQNLRRTDETNTVSDWVNRVVTKLWRVKAQFQDLEEIDLVNESGVPDPQTGITTVNFYPPIDSERAKRLKNSRFRFNIEVGSTQKPNLEIVRAQFEQFVKALMEPVVTQGLALEGKRLSATEILRQWARFFEEHGLQDIAKMVVPVQEPNMQNALLNFGNKPESGSQNGGVAAQAPNRADMISAAAGERGQGASPV